jgi:predicted aminopeptidase
VNVRFRNLDTDPAAPVTSWPYEALVTAIERDGIRDWARRGAARARGRRRTGAGTGGTLGGVRRAEFASRIGTSRPRLSTYCTGSVTPSAALVERMRALVDRMSAG